MDRDQFDQWAEERRKRRAERDAVRAERRREQRNERSEEGSSPRRGPPKARVLHTRISDQLDESLRLAADELRVPVSNLVRNVLEDVFTVVETVTDNVGDLVEDLFDEADAVGERLIRRPSRGRRRRRKFGSPTPPTDDPDWRAAEREVSEMVDEDRQPGTGEREQQAESPAEDRQERPEFADVIGWQPLVLNGDQRCADCGRDLVRGDRSFLGISDAPSPRRYLCPECVRARDEPVD